MVEWTLGGEGRLGYCFYALVSIWNILGFVPGDSYLASDKPKDRLSRDLVSQYNVEGLERWLRRPKFGFPDPHQAAHNCL